MLQSADPGHCCMRGGGREGWIGRQAGRQPPLVVDHPRTTRVLVSASLHQYKLRALPPETVPPAESSFRPRFRRSSIVEPPCHCKRLVSITRFPIYRPCKIAPIYTSDFDRSIEPLEKLIVKLRLIYIYVFHWKSRTTFDRKYEK